MTAIAYRDGVMAADGLDLSGSIVSSRVARKIARRADGALCGASGDAMECERILAAFVEDQLDRVVPTRDKDNSYAALIVWPNGKVHRITEAGHSRLSEAPFYTEGSAYQVLTGAMAAGATAEQAVRIAMEWHTECGGEIQVERL